MWTSYLSAILTRELRTLCREIRSYPDDDALWLVPHGLPNAAGTLALHLVGNLQHYVGAKLGGTGYRRDRPAEFSRRGVPREDIVREAEEAMSVVEKTLARLNRDTLEADFPEPVGGKVVRTEEFLVHLATHLAYHLGQLDYHRRLVAGESGPVGAVTVAELSSARTDE